MLTLRELLEDKVYREYFTSRPILPANIHPDLKLWRVYVQRETEGPWAKKEFHDYVQAFKFLKPYLKTCHDATIQSKGIAFAPPFKVVRVVRKGKPVLDDKQKPVVRRVVWRPLMPTDEQPHRWCPYCRRPTVFAWFAKHHAFPKGYTIATPYQRCVICGASERLVDNHG